MPFGVNGGLVPPFMSCDQFRLLEGDTNCGFFYLNGAPRLQWTRAQNGDEAGYELVFDGSYRKPMRELLSF